MEKKKYFSIGEFAQLFHVSKQTLFYYERNHIFSPNYINEKGYRFYSFDQFCIFEIITSLRMIHVPLKKIAWYLEHRSIENLRDLLREKQAEYQEEIELIQKNQRHIAAKLKKINLAENVKSDRITLEHHDAHYLIATPFPPAGSTLDEDLHQLAVHNGKLWQGLVLNENLTGFLLPKEAIQEKRYMALSHYVTQVSEPEDYKDLMIKPAGLYATIYKKHSYHTRYVEAIETLQSFIDKNALEVVGHAYLTPIRNFWSTEEPDDYITEISIQVNYISDLHADSFQETATE